MLLKGAALLFGGALVFKIGRFGLGALIPVIFGIGTALLWLAGLLVANPIVAGLLLIAGLAYLIYRNWDGIAEFFSDIWGKITDGASAVGDWIGEKLRQGIDRLRGVVSGVGDFLTNLIPDSWWEKAGNLLQQGFDWLKGIVSDAADAITGLINRIRGAIESLSNLSIGGGVAKGGPSTMEGFPGVDGARARGGSVYAGRLYTVGERGPELFQPSRTGRIIAPYRLSDERATFVGRGGAPVMVSATFHIHGATDPNATARIVSRQLNRIARSGLHDGAYD